MTNSMKKAVAVFTAVATVASMAPTMAFAADKTEPATITISGSTMNKTKVAAGDSIVFDNLALDEKTQATYDKALQNGETATYEVVGITVSDATADDTDEKGATTKIGGKTYEIGDGVVDTAAVRADGTKTVLASGGYGVAGDDYFIPAGTKKEAELLKTDGKVVLPADDTEDAVVANTVYTANETGLLTFEGFEVVEGKGVNTTVIDDSAVATMTDEELAKAEDEGIPFTTKDGDLRSHEYNVYVVAKYSIAQTDEDFTYQTTGTVSIDGAVSDYEIGDEETTIELPVLADKSGQEFKGYEITNENATLATITGPAKNKAGETVYTLTIGTLADLDGKTDAALDYDIVVESVYDDALTITFDAGEDGTIDVEEGETFATTQLAKNVVALPTITANDNAAFVGWSTDGTRANIVKTLPTAAKLATMATKNNVTFTAVYVVDRSETIVEVEKIVEVPVEVEKIVEVEVPVEKIVEKTVEVEKKTVAPTIKATKKTVKVKKTAKVGYTLGTAKTLTVKSSNAKVAKVSKTAKNIVIKGVKKGSAKITATFKNADGSAWTKTIKVTVKK